jgi:signal transduction histidine kinase
MIANAPGRRRRTDRSVRRSIIALIVTALVAFAVVGAGAATVARHIARKDALQEAVRSAHVVSSTVFGPLISEVLAGDTSAIGKLDDAVRVRARDGSLVRVKVWQRDGTVLYSDDASAIGNRYPLDTDVAESIDKQRDKADLSNLTDPENATERLYKRLVEVYIPLNLDDGTHLAFEMYASDARVVAAENGLRNQLVPFALLALLILLISQLPVSVWLVRRVGRAQSERSRLLNSALAASGRERQAIARDLHDGVVQDLAAATYASEALSRTLPSDIDERSRTLAATVRGVLTKSVAALRTLMVDIYPPDLNARGLRAAIEELAEKVGPDTEATVAIDLESEPSPEVSAMLYRCARECLANVAKHADARHVEVQLTGDGQRVRMRIHDDGVGLPPEGIDRRTEGHLGLQLVRDAVKDLGGDMRVFTEESGGATVVLDLPSTSVGLVGNTS